MLVSSFFSRLFCGDGIVSLSAVSGKLSICHLHLFPHTMSHLCLLCSWHHSLLSQSYSNPAGSPGYETHSCRMTYSYFCPSLYKSHLYKPYGIRIGSFVAFLVSSVCKCTNKISTKLKWLLSLAHLRRSFFFLGKYKDLFKIFIDVDHLELRAIFKIVCDQMLSRIIKSLPLSVVVVVFVKWNKGEINC